MCCIARFGGDGVGLRQTTACDAKDRADARGAAGQTRQTPLGLTVVEVTVLRDGLPMEGVEVGFSRSISGLPSVNQWTGSRYTDEKGRVRVEIVAEWRANEEPDFGQFGRVGVTGYYRATATDPVSGKVLGQWGSIPISDGQSRDLILEIGEQARLGPSVKLDAVRAEPVAFENLREASNLRVRKSGTAVFKNAASWESFWHSSLPPILAIDFKKQILIAVFWGGEPHSGCGDYVEAVESVSREGDRIRVHVGRLPSLGPCRVVVYPLQIIRIDRSDLPVIFTGEVPVGRGG